MKKELIVSTGIALGGTLCVVLTNLNELTGNQIVIKITVTFIISFILSFLLLHFYLNKVKKH
jgi:hypothetical protein